MSIHQPLSDKQLEEWEALAKEATEGPWTHDFERDAIRVDGMWQDVESSSIETDELMLFVGMDCTEADGEFVAAARTAVPDLLQEVRMLRRQVRYLDNQIRYAEASGDVDPLTHEDDV